VNNSEFWEEYERRLQSIADEVEPQLPQPGDEEHFNGREWCEENGVPETVFADAMRKADADWGVSPMYPWRDNYNE
jgi:hypothetical protein